MKLHEHKETTPLAFYKAFIYVLLPLGAVTCVYTLLFYIFSESMYSVYAAWYMKIMIILCIGLLILYGFIFFGLLKWKKYTLILFAVLLALCCLISALNIVHNAVSPMAQVYSGITEYQMTEEFSSLLGTITTIFIVISAVVNIGLYLLLFVYFYKRKLLFDGVPYKIPPKSAQYYPRQQPCPPQYDPAPVRNCSNCGARRPSAEYRFCPECGKEYNEK